MKILLSVLILFVHIESIAQNQAALPEIMLCSSVNVSVGKYTGSGFFLQDSCFAYFVTARHVLVEGGELVSQHCVLTFYANNVYTESPSIMEIDLKSAVKNKLMRYDKDKDVAVIAITRKIASVGSNATYGEFTDEGIKMIKIGNPNTPNSRPISLKNTMSYSEINVGNEVYLFGYPVIGKIDADQFDTLRPLLRKGIIAGKYEKNKTIIIDCPSYGGNSGGPVFEILDRSFDPTIKLIGYVTQYIPQITGIKTRKDSLTMVAYFNTGYTVIRPIDDVIKLVEKFNCDAK